MPLFTMRSAEAQALKLEKPLNVETTGVPLRGVPGEHLLIFSSGRLAVLSDDLFREIFQPARNGKPNGRPNGRRNGQSRASAANPEEPTACFADAVRTELLHGPATTAEIEARLRESGMAVKRNHVSSICSQRAKVGEFGRDKEGRWFMAERR